MKFCVSLSMDGLRYCDDAACPSTHQQRELLMHCSELRLEPDQREALLFEFEDGSRVNAAWDNEGQTASCLLPKVERAAHRLRASPNAWCTVLDA